MNCNKFTVIVIRYIHLGKIQPLLIFYHYFEYFAELHIWDLTVLLIVLVVIAVSPFF